MTIVGFRARALNMRDDRAKSFEMKKQVVNFAKSHYNLYHVQILITTDNLALIQLELRH